jgi:hypothetical protein
MYLCALLFPGCTNALKASNERGGEIVSSGSAVVPCTIAIEDDGFSISAALGLGEARVE